MKIRIQGATRDELAQVEAALRLVLEVGESSADFPNRRRGRPPGFRRYLNDVVPRTELDVWAVVFGNYEPAEVRSLHATRELAEAGKAEADKQLDTHMHQVDEMSVELVAGGNAPGCDERDEHPPHAPCTGREASGSHRYVAGDDRGCSFIVGIGEAMCGAAAGDAFHEGWGAMPRGDAP